MVRTSGVAGSARLGITDAVLAWDLDNAVTLRLMQFDNAKDKANRKFWVSLVSGSEKAEEMFPEI
jgi:hypothetical protein